MTGEKKTPPPARPSGERPEGLGVITTLALHEDEWSEFEPSSIPSGAFAAVEELYQTQFETEHPNPRNGGKYGIRPGGYVGSFPVDDSLTLSVQPTVPIQNLFRMLEYVYQLDVLLPNGIAGVDTSKDGPTTRHEGHESAPFQINMPRLFEVFVGSWLRGHLPPTMTLDSQHTAHLDKEGFYAFRAELVLRSVRSSEALAVLDMKYKRESDVSLADLNQIFTYASTLHTRKAFLVYPSHATATRSITIENVSIQSVVFDLSGDLELAGEAFALDVIRNAGVGPPDPVNPDDALLG